MINESITFEFRITFTHMDPIREDFGFFECILKCSIA